MTKQFIISERSFAGNSIDIFFALSSNNDILGLEIDNITCESSSGSTLKIRGKALQLNTASSSGSSIDYKGSPKTVIKEESSGGSVSKE